MMPPRLPAPGARLGAMVVLCVASIVVQGASASAQDAPRPATGASFFDDFSKYDHKRWYISHGWNNGPHTGCGWSA
jgi:endo-1,3-1,4-beta-glycanase ExoK